MPAAMSGNVQPATWSSSYTQSPDGTGTLALHSLSRATGHPHRAEKRNRAGVQNQAPGVGRGWWAGFSEKRLSPGTRAEQNSWQRPPRERPPRVPALGPGGEGGAGGRDRRPRQRTGPVGRGAPEWPLPARGSWGTFDRLQGGAHTSASAQGALGPGGT